MITNKMATLLPNMLLFSLHCGMVVNVASLLSFTCLSMRLVTC